MEKSNDYRLISDAPDLFFRMNPDRVAIDEAQLLPELFAALRVAIDCDRTARGRFVITGSSSPELLKSISESLAGRIGIIQVSPLSLEELTSEDATFYRLFERSDDFKAIIDNLSERGNLSDIHDCWFRGGYPEPWSINQVRFTEVWMEHSFGVRFPHTNET